MQAESNKTHQVTAFLVGLVGTADPEYALGESLTAGSCWTAARSVSGGTRGTTRAPRPLLTAVGEIYERLGLYDEAETRLREALAAARNG